MGSSLIECTNPAKWVAKCVNSLPIGRERHIGVVSDGKAEAGVVPSASGYGSCARKAVSATAWEAFHVLLLLKDTELVVAHLVDRAVPAGTQEKVGSLRFSTATATPLWEPSWPRVFS